MRIIRVLEQEIIRVFVHITQPKSVRVGQRIMDTGNEEWPSYTKATTLPAAVVAPSRAKQLPVELQPAVQPSEVSVAEAIVDTERS